jgi:hypothetical protein
MRWNEKWYIRACLHWHELEPYEIVEFVQTYHKTIAGQKNALLRFRKFAEKYYADVVSAEWLQYCKLPRSQLEIQRTLDTRQVVLKAQSPVNCDVQYYLQVMCEFLANDSDVVSLAAGLLMATGRRTIELAECGQLSMTRQRHMIHPTYWVKFRGPAKKQDQDKAKKIAWDIPVLANSDQIISKFHKLRALGDGMSVKSAIWQSSLKALFRSKFGKVFPELLPKTCRAVYAVVSMQMFNPFMAVNFWTKEILGHTSVQTSMNYLSVHLSNVRLPCETFGIDLPGFRLHESSPACVKNLP